MGRREINGLAVVTPHRALDLASTPVIQLFPIVSNGCSNFSVGVCSCVCAVSYSFNELNFLQKKLQKHAYSFEHSDTLILVSCSWNFPDFNSQQGGGQLGAY